MQRLIRFIFILGFIAAVILFFLLGIVVFAYLFMIGFIVGLIAYVVAMIKQRWVKPKKSVKPEKTAGRIIDSDDWKELK